MVLCEGMANEKLYSRAELIALAGVDEEALIFWLRKGLLESEVTESRKHKRFTLAEIRFAKVMTYLRSFGVNIGHMADIVRFLRSLETMAERVPQDAPLVDAMDAVEQGLSRAEFRAKIEHGHPTLGEIADQTFDLVSDPDTSIDAWDLCAAYSDRLPMAISVSQSGEVAMQFPHSFDTFATPAMIVLDLKQIFDGLEA